MKVENHIVDKFGKDFFCYAKTRNFRYICHS